MLGLGLGLGAMAYHDSINSPYNSLKSLSFGGTDEYVTVPDHINYTPNAGLAVGGAGSDRGFSISMWVKFPAGVASKFLISKDTVYPHVYEWTTLANYAGKAKFELYSTPNSNTTNLYSAVATSFIFSTDTWHHVVWTWNLDSNTASNTTTGDIKLYIDGVNTAVDITKSGTFDYVKDGGKNLSFAKFSGSYSVVKLDEVAIFDDNLSQSKVTEYYNLGKPIDLAGQDFLHGYWRMGDGDSNATDGIIDSSTYANHGTMTNMEAGDIVTDAP
jgi:hypothetical protein